LRKYIITTALFICLALLIRAPAEKCQSVFPTVAYESVDVTNGSVVAGFFSAAFETVAFIFRDGSFLAFSTNDDKAVTVPISWVVEHIQKTGHAVPDIILCVHNHFSPVGFTPADQDSYWYLKRKGFSGVFGIYYTVSGRFREFKESANK